MLNRSELRRLSQVMGLQIRRNKVIQAFVVPLDIRGVFDQNRPATISQSRESTRDEDEQGT